jgi:hypothetical protein
MNKSALQINEEISISVFLCKVKAPSEGIIKIRGLG